MARRVCTGVFTTANCGQTSLHNSLLYKDLGSIEIWRRERDSPEPSPQLLAAKRIAAQALLASEVASSSKIIRHHPTSLDVIEIRADLYTEFTHVHADLLQLADQCQLAGVR